MSELNVHEIAVTEEYEAYHGEKFKLNIGVSPIAGVTMDDYDFFLELSTPYSAPITINKSEMKRKDSDNYRAMVDTLLLGIGKLEMKFHAEIPDGDFPDQLRTVIKEIDNKINIRK